MSSIREQLITNIQNLTDELGRAPTPDEINKHSSYAMEDYRNQFGSWAEALATAGLKKPKGRRIPTDSLLAELQRLAEELDKTPSEQDMRKQGKHTIEVYRNRFGSWSQALEVAGFDPRPDRTKRPREELLAELRRVADELGHTPTSREIAEYSDFGRVTYRNRFGSWNEALEAAGLEPRSPKRKLSQEELLEELQRLTDETGQIPTTGDMRRDGKFSPGTYINRFGSWRDALEAAGFEPS